MKRVRSIVTSQWVRTSLSLALIALALPSFAAGPVSVTPSPRPRFESTAPRAPIARSAVPGRPVTGATVPATAGAAARPAGAPAAATLTSPAATTAPRTGAQPVSGAKPQASPAARARPLKGNAWKLARLVRSKDPAARLNDLTWERDVLEVTSSTSGSMFVPRVKFRGFFKNREWTLVQADEPVTLEKDGSFVVELALKGESTSIELFAVGPMGEVAPEKTIVWFPGYANYGHILRDLRMPKPSIFTSVGLTSIQYTQTFSNPLSENVLTGRVSYQTILSRNWDIGFTSYLTLLQLTSSDPGTVARFFGLNGRIGYAAPLFREPWRLSLMGGFYYTTMFTSSPTGGNFGYKSVMGPMVYPVLRRILSPLDSVSTYFKFSPISAGSFSVMSTNSRELAVGFSYSRSAPESTPWSLSVDYADTQLTLGRVISRARSVSAGLALGW